MYFALIMAILIVMYAWDLLISVLNYNNRHAPIPKEVEDVYDGQSYQKWLEYSMANFKLGIVSKTTNVVLLILLLILGGFPWVDAIIGLFAQGFILQTIFFLFAYFLLSFFVGIPFSYYKQFVIEEKFGFNRTSTKTFVLDKIKSMLLTVFLGAPLLYLIAKWYQQTGVLFILWVWLTGVSILFFINATYTKLFVPMFNKLKPLEEGELREAIVAFAKSVGYEVTKISVMNASKRSTKLNAFFSGFGKMKQVVLFDTLILKLTKDEVVSVLAHEIGHAKHRDVFKNMMLSFLMLSMYTAVMWATLQISALSIAFGFSSAHFGFGLILFTILISPVDRLLDIPITYLSRRAEYKADSFAAVHWTKESMISALKQLARSNFSNLTPHPLFVKMTYTHPPISERIRAIENIKENGYVS